MDGNRTDPKFSVDQVVWEWDYDINSDSFAKARLGVVTEVRWSDLSSPSKTGPQPGWIVTVKFPHWPDAAVNFWLEMFKKFGGCGHNGVTSDLDGNTKTVHEDYLVPLTVEEFGAGRLMVQEERKC